MDEYLVTAVKNFVIGVDKLCIVWGEQFLPVVPEYFCFDHPICFSFFHIFSPLSQQLLDLFNILLDSGIVLHCPLNFTHSMHNRGVILAT